MSLPTRESAIGEAKDLGAKLHEGEWVFTGKTMGGNKKKSVARKMGKTKHK